MSGDSRPWQKEGDGIKGSFELINLKGKIGKLRLKIVT